MADEPLSTLQLEQMRGYAEAIRTAKHAIESVSSELVIASDYMLTLLAEVERLRAENAAMREIVQAVADKGGECWEAGDNVCLYCHARIQAGVTGLEDDSVPHTADCLVTKARVLLATPQE